VMKLLLFFSNMKIFCEARPRPRPRCRSRHFLKLSTATSAMPFAPFFESIYCGTTVRTLVYVCIQQSAYRYGMYHTYGIHDYVVRYSTNKVRYVQYVLYYVLYDTYSTKP
jgi:hypothetical protein